MCSAVVPAQAPPVSDAFPASVTLPNSSVVGLNRSKSAAAAPPVKQSCAHAAQPGARIHSAFLHCACTATTPAPASPVDDASPASATSLSNVPFPGPPCLPQPPSPLDSTLLPSRVPLYHAINNPPLCEISDAAGPPEYGLDGRGFLAFLRHKPCGFMFSPCGWVCTPIGDHDTFCRRDFQVSTRSPKLMAPPFDLPLPAVAREDRAAVPPVAALIKGNAQMLERFLSKGNPAPAIGVPMEVVRGPLVDDAEDNAVVADVAAAPAV